MDWTLAPLWLLVYVAWTILLGTVLMTWRVGMVMSDKLDPQHFTHGKDHGHTTYWRCCRAHANAVENLPLFATIVLAEQLAAAGTPGMFGSMATGVVAARIIQSIIHMGSDSKTAVMGRYVFFLIQMVLMILMLFDVMVEDFFAWM